MDFGQRVSGSLFGKKVKSIGNGDFTTTGLYRSHTWDPATEGSVLVINTSNFASSLFHDIKLSNNYTPKEGDELTIVFRGVGYVAFAPFCDSFPHSMPISHYTYCGGVWDSDVDSRAVSSCASDAWKTRELPATSTQLAHGRIVSIASAS